MLHCFYVSIDRIQQQQYCRTLIYISPPSKTQPKRKKNKKAASIINIWVFFIQHQNNWTDIGLVIYIQNSIFISPPWKETKMLEKKKWNEKQFKIPRICVTIFFLSEKVTESNSYCAIFVCL